MEQKNEGSTTASEGTQSTADTSQLDAKELLDRVSKLEATNKRLLEESNDYKKKFKSATSTVEDTQKKIALEKGDLQKLLDMEREEKKRITEEAQGLKKSVVKEKLHLAISKHAQDAVNVEDFFNQPSFSHILKEAIDEDSLSINDDKVKLYVSEIFKAKPHYKKQLNQPSTVTRKPGQIVNGAQKPFDKMSAKELEEYIRANFS